MNAESTAVLHDMISETKQKLQGVDMQRLALVETQNILLPSLHIKLDVMNTS